MNTLAKSGGAWLVSPSLTAALRRTSVAGFSTSETCSFPNWEGGVSMVQGASRGLGLEFVRQLLENSKKGYVVATCRNPKEATSLSDLKKRFSERLFIQKLDVTDETTIEESAESVRERYGSLNLLVNATGILSIPGVLQPETTLSKVEKSSLMLAYEVNAVGPILVMKHMWPLLKAGGGNGTEREVAVVANISARVGSIGDNRLGGWHSYRASKTALNQLTKNVSVELGRRKDPVVCILLHPGTVDTDLSRPFQRNVPEGKLFTKAYSVQKLLHIINNAKRQDNGKFFAWDGQEIPW
uniref:C-factor n=2 Tax=Noccaea caerulescens TaxID=107243 RepID=A0A1J3E1F9_NOCCA